MKTLLLSVEGAAIDEAPRGMQSAESSVPGEPNKVSGMPRKTVVSHSGKNYA
jgi:hypothetical protein